MVAGGLEMVDVSEWFRKQEIPVSSQRTNGSTQQLEPACNTPILQQGMPGAATEAAHGIRRRML